MNFLGPPTSPERYGIGPLLGAGAEGVVYRGTRRDASPRFEVSIKIVRSTEHEGVDALERRLSEVELTRSISNPGMVPIIDGFVHDADEGPPTLVLISPWVEGRSLDEVATEMSAAEITTAVTPVAQALDFMHSGQHALRQPIIHLDVKPSNIIVTSAGTGRLIDFGLSRPVGSGPPGIGTRGFRAGSATTGQYDEASDRHAFAATVAAALRRSVDGSELADRIEPRAVASSHDALSDWLAGVRHRRTTRWPAVIGSGVVALAAVVGVAAGFAASDDACDVDATTQAAAAAGLEWHDPDGDCLHSAFELSVNESAADAATRSDVVPPPAEQIGVVPAHLVGCDAATWEALAVDLADGVRPRQSWSDRDGDCLHDAYEINALGTDPLDPDTDADGVADTFDHGTTRLLHDPLAQLRHLDRLADLATRLEVVDAVSCDPDLVEDRAVAWFASESIREGWLDTDGDCLRDEFEIDVLGSNPQSADTDGDGWPDGTDPDLSSGLIEPIDTQIEGNAWRQETRDDRLDAEAQPRAPGD